jgi:hypothetical protein
VVEKRWWFYLRWLHDLKMVEHEKALLAGFNHIEYKKAR